MEGVSGGLSILEVHLMVRGELVAVREVSLEVLIEELDLFSSELQLLVALVFLFLQLFVSETLCLKFGLQLHYLLLLHKNLFLQLLHLSLQILLFCLQIDFHLELRGLIVIIFSAGFF